MLNLLARKGLMPRISDEPLTFKLPAGAFGVSRVSSTSPNPHPDRDILRA